jgi:hypothetical protein
MEPLNWLTSTNLTHFHRLENHQFKVELVIFQPMDDASVPGTQGNIAWVST